MVVVDPQSTTFQRSEAWRLLVDKDQILWSQQWVDYERISPNLKRAVIASEDAGFADHSGVDWDAIEKAWERNQRAEERAESLNLQLERRAAKHAGKPAPPRRRRAQPRWSAARPSRSSWPRTCSSAASAAWPRKGQEFVITLMLEALLSKQRILEIYLNSVEWGEGLFGAQAAARHYFRTDAATLGADAGGAPGGDAAGAQALREAARTRPT